MLVHYCPVPPARIACGAAYGLSDDEIRYVTCPDCLRIAAGAVTAKEAP